MVYNYEKNTPMFRDIPCNKDIYYANALIRLNKFNYKKSNLIGAIILKWVKEDKIRFNIENNSIDLTLKPSFDKIYEKLFFDLLYNASKDGILESNELKKYCRKHKQEILDILLGFENKVIRRLSEDNLIYKNSSDTCKYYNIMDESLYEDSKKLYGLKLFLDEFSKIDTKEVIDVKLWDEYLMFAYLFGIADKVSKQLKNLYPELIKQTKIDFNNIMIINNLFSYTSKTIRQAGISSTLDGAREVIKTRDEEIAAAINAANRGSSGYSSGGGGSSSGGGGGGSFGGGSR